MRASYVILMSDLRKQRLINMPVNTSFFKKDKKQKPDE